MTLRQGMDQQREAVERRGSGGAATYIRWPADKDTKVLRFLTQANEIFFLKVHDFVPCHDGKNRSFICATEDERECELCAAQVKVRELGYGIAIEREEVTPKSNNYQDKVNNEGNPIVGIVTQGWNNFWKFIDEYYQRLGDLRDIDFDITRHGAKLQTSYTIIPFAPKPLADVSVYDEFRPDLKKILDGMVSQDYYNLHLHGIKPVGNEDVSDNDGDDDAEERSQFEALQAKFGTPATV